MAIKKLDKETVEKIAAGEVIESPLSIIKELVENSVDAGSKNITVEIKNGGKTYIRVTDDGSGIAKDDIELAFEKHATSKITKFDDLFKISSLGFRGEALPSIASVSKVVAISKTQDADVGTKLDLSGRVKVKKSIATNKGTSIIVEDLFYNMPARRKFLKSDIAESNKITKLMYAFAIGYKDVSFKYIKDDRIQFQSNTSLDLKFKISDLLDNLLEENLLELKATNTSYRIDGEIGLPTYYRGNRSMQYIFVNDRLIEDEEITKTIERQYIGLIPQGRFPAFFIFIYTDPKNIDVNIHPNKKLVKYTYEDELVELINDSVKNLLKSKQAINSIDIKDKKQNQILDFTDYKAVLDKYSPAEMLIREEEKPYNSIESNQDFFNDKISIDLYTNEEKIREDSFFSDIEVPSYKTSIFRRYSIFEDKEKIYILDHRKAEEKIKMSEYINDYNSNKISRQLVLNPIKINLNKIDIGRYEQKQDLFNKLGFDIELISDKSIIIREIPIIFDIPENNNFFYEILDFEDNENILFKNLRKLVKNISFRKGNTINKDEAIELYKKLMKEEDPYRTYDGKPTIITLEDKDLEKYFER
ncbi:DNA mismatch repair endonuclease MutL [Anaerococcus lactolyticus]|uniref:DNA mismatch repair protein MutL n=1 Tax=Anaerococcus lactolyticus S7-1-13 TaxID=1284686 RepID=A0A095WZB9_9FIRM|nr:DNA mismatch repair endonuclease MutL [Anaerococcus lactolyticus]KGF03165.1 DNA mismatch repair protein MutL [Anaerococcus lactolyticus S7-1-13]